MAKIHIVAEGTVDTDLTDFHHASQTLESIAALKTAAEALGIRISITEVTTNLPAVISEPEAVAEPQTEAYLSDIQREVINLVQRYPGRTLPALLAKKRRKTPLSRQEKKSYENAVSRMISKGMLIRTDSPEAPFKRLLWPVQK